MILVLGYLLVNILISVFLEKRRYHMATVLHAAAFTCCLVLLLPFSQSALIERALVNMMGEAVYLFLRQALLQAGVAGIAPIVVLELSVPLLAVGLTIAATIHTARRIVNKWRLQEASASGEKSWKKSGCRRAAPADHIYRIHCVMRC